MDFNPVMWALCKQSGGSSGGGSGGDNFPIGDGNTHIWFEAAEGEKLYLGIGINGLVTIDWGDGETSECSGASVEQPVYAYHEFQNAGCHVISLTTDGEIGFVLRTESSSTPALFSFNGGKNYSSSDSRWQNCLARIRYLEMGNAVTHISPYSCHRTSMVCAIISNNVTSIPNNAFQNSFGLTRINIPSGVTNIGSLAFGACYGVEYYDFSHHTAVPSLESQSAFNGKYNDFTKILVPESLYDEWKAATNWSSLASFIVAV